MRDSGPEGVHNGPVGITGTEGLLVEKDGVRGWGEAKDVTVIGTEGKLCKNFESLQ